VVEAQLAKSEARLRAADKQYDDGAPASRRSGVPAFKSRRVARSARVESVRENGTASNSRSWYLDQFIHSLISCEKVRTVISGLSRQDFRDSIIS